MASIRPKNACSSLTIWGLENPSTAAVLGLADIDQAIGCDQGTRWTACTAVSSKRSVNMFKVPSESRGAGHCTTQEGNAKFVLCLSLSAWKVARQPATSKGILMIKMSLGGSEGSFACFLGSYSTRRNPCDRPEVKKQCDPSSCDNSQSVQGTG